MRIRYDVPASALASCVSGYAIYVAEDRSAMTNWFLPAPAMITILLDAGPATVTFHGTLPAVIDQASVWGSTRRSYRTITHGGISVGIGLTALGWAKLTRRPANMFIDRISPLTTVAKAEFVRSIVSELEALNDDAEIAPLLDARLPALFAADYVDDQLLTELDRLIVTEGIIGVEDVAKRLGIASRVLRRIATEQYGMTPKTLLTRARFIRSFIKWLLNGEAPSYTGIDPSYFDTAHFLYDAQRYLGTTPRRFVFQETSYLKASLRARAAAIGAAAHALHSGLK